MNLTKDVKSLITGIFSSMSAADQEILKSELTRTPENQGIMNPVYSKNDFLRGTQLGRLNEQQLKWYYAHLDAMDRFHKNGGAIGKRLNEAGITILTKPKGDEESGFTEEFSFPNKKIDSGFVSDGEKTLTVLRDGALGVYKIEDYCTEVVIKKGYQGLLAEFYCSNYPIEATNIYGNLYETLNSDEYNKLNFLNIKAFNGVRSTATRNSINHNYKIISLFKMKQLDKGFVVKFLVEELG